MKIIATPPPMTGEGAGGGEHFIFPPHPCPLPPGERSLIIYAIPIIQSSNVLDIGVEIWILFDYWCLVIGA
jgi:hypothetical protein